MESSPITNLGIETLMKKQGTVDGKAIFQQCDTEELSQFDLVGLFFSAYWCPPCNSFTSCLKKFVKDVSNDDPFSFLKESESSP